MHANVVLQDKEREKGLEVGESVRRKRNRRLVCGLGPSHVGIKHVIITNEKMNP